MAATKNGPGLHHLAIRATDYDRTLTFYAEGLGFTRRYGWGADGHRAAMLDAGDGNYMEVFEGRKDKPSSEGAILHYALRVKSCDAAYAKAIKAGATSQMEPKNVDIDGDYPVPVRIAFVVGLDGEVIEFYENDEL